MQTQLPAQQAKQNQSQIEHKLQQPLQAQFEDARPETTAQLRMQSLMANSAQSTQLKSMQAMMAANTPAKKLGQSPSAINPIPLQRMEDEEPLQAKADEPVQREQAETPNAENPGAEPPPESTPPPKPNNTGLPDNLKSGIENLSGMSMDRVKVHYNSDKPAQLQAHAYAQGSEIHVAPGQEQHLPHEAWHVVQQAQGRVRPTMQMKGGVGVNDDVGLEREADVMGAKALASDISQPMIMVGHSGAHSRDLVQRKIGFEIEVIGLRIMEPEENEFSDEDEGLALAIPPARQLNKGEVLHQGGGWKLTPDGKDGNSWTPEYIVAAVDETTDLDSIQNNVSAVADHAKNNLDSPATWTHGTDLEVDDEGELFGSFHITGGLRLSRIKELIKVLYDNQDAANAGSEKALANRADNISFSGDNYKSVVALVALQVKDLLEAQRRDEDSAKLGVSMLSRTDLGVVVEKVTSLTTREGFINDVLRTANVVGTSPLFRHHLPGVDARGRTIDAQQGLTVRQWLVKLLSGHDFVWSETRNDQGRTFGYDKVGPSFLGHRADGVILELRGGILEQGNNSPPVDEWANTAFRYARLFKALNAKEDTAKITRDFHPPQEEGEQGGDVSDDDNEDYIGF